MEKLKYITSELNEQLSTDYNCASFNALTPQKLLQVVVELMFTLGLTDFQPSYNEINPLEIFNVLEAIRYSPEENITPTQFREGLTSGCKKVVYSILIFLLQHKESVKKRHYLSQYVSPIEVPNDILQDDDVQNLHSIYKQLIEEFWDVYAENNREKANAFESVELKDDIWQMKVDLGNLHKRVILQKDKLVGVTKDRLDKVRAYCKESRRGETLLKQLQNEKKNYKNLKDDCYKYQGRPKINSLNDLIEQSGYNQLSLVSCESILPELENEVEIYRNVNETLEPSIEELQDLQDAVLEIQIFLKEIKVNDYNTALINQINSLKNKEGSLKRQIMCLRLKNDEMLVKIGALQGSSMKEYISHLRHINLIYKEYKQRMNALEGEKIIIANTFKILTENQNINFEELRRKENVVITKEDTKKVYNKYDMIRTDFILDDLKYNSTKNAMEDLQRDLQYYRSKFEEDAGNIQDELEKLHINIEEVWKQIEIETNVLQEYEKEIELYQDNLVKYSQCIIENEGDDSYVETAREKLKVAKEKRLELQDKIECKKLEKQDNGELEAIKNVKNMILLKLQ